MQSCDLPTDLNGRPKEVHGLVRLTRNGLVRLEHCLAEAESHGSAHDARVVFWHIDHLHMENNLCEFKDFSLIDFFLTDYSSSKQVTNHS